MNGGLQQSARVLQASIADLHRITTPVAVLNSALWPPCALCSAPVGECDCDPDLVMKHLGMEGTER